MPSRSPVRADEAARLAALRRLGLLDTGPEAAFDDFTRLAAHICGTPIALITLIDEHRQWFKSTRGLTGWETAREHAFCAHTIMEDRLMEVRDAAADPRFADNPYVRGAPNIRFYAGQPIRSPDGYPLGSLCVVDHQPRALSTEQRDALAVLTRQVETHIALRDTLVRLDAARASLLEEQSFSRNLLDSMLEGLVITDIEGRIEAVNPAVEAMFGDPAAAFVGRRVTDYLQDVAPREADDRGGRLAAAIGRVTEWQGRRADGETFPLEAQVWAFGPSGRRKLACHVRDLSRQREAERVKRRFVATVSHELRTPLTSIRGALGLVADGGAGALDPEVRELVDVAYRNTNRLMRLVNDILDFERLSTGGLSVDVKPTGLSALLQRAHEVVRSVADSSGVRISLPRTTALVHADGDRIVQVLVNLLSNALKFSPRGGELAVRVEPADGKVTVWVEDEGPGVPVDARASIFEPFRQIEGSPAHKKGGTGLGLSISRAIVHEHGGQMGVTERADGRPGAAFWFTLNPVRRALQ